MVKVDVGSLGTQASSVSSSMSARVSALTSAISALENFSQNNDNLKGEAYTQAMTFGTGTLVPLLQGMILFSEGISERASRLRDLYTSLCGDESLDSTVLENAIYREELALRSASNMMRILERDEYATPYAVSRHRAYTDDLRRQLASSRQKLEKLMAFDRQSQSIFRDIEHMEMSVTTGLSEVGSVFNNYSTTKSFDLPNGNNPEWKKRIKGNWDRRTQVNEELATIQKKLQNGEELSSEDIKSIRAYREYYPSKELPQEVLTKFEESNKKVTKSKEEIVEKVGDRKAKRKSKSSSEIIVDSDISDLDAGVDGHLGKVATGDEGAGASITVGRGYASAGLLNPFSVDKDKGENDKNTTFALGGKAEVGAVVTEAEAHGRYGNDKNDIHGNVYGSTHSVSADASAAIGAFTNKDGEIVKGIQAEAGADAFILEGEVTAGFKLFGINVDISGSAGVGFSARAKVGVTSEAAEAKMKIGPVGLGLSIGW